MGKTEERQTHSGFVQCTLVFHSVNFLDGVRQRKPGKDNSIQFGGLAADSQPLRHFS